MKPSRRWHNFLFYFCCVTAPLNFALARAFPSQAEYIISGCVLVIGAILNYVVVKTLDAE